MALWGVKALLAAVALLVLLSPWLFFLDGPGAAPHDDADALAPAVAEPGARRWSDDGEEEDAGGRPREDLQGTRAKVQKRLSAAWNTTDQKRQAKLPKAAQSEQPKSLNQAAWEASQRAAFAQAVPEAQAGNADEASRVAKARAQDLATAKARAQTLVQPPLPTGERVWVFCAPQWQECICEGKIRWGNAGKYQEIKPKGGKTTAHVECAVGKNGLKDVRPGDNAKHCECHVEVGTPYFSSLNPLLLPKDAPLSPGTKLVGDCDTYAQAKNDGDHGRAQWQAASGYCKFGDGVRGGQKAIDNNALRKSMKVFLDSRFARNYELLTDAQGWLEYAFVSNCAMPPTGDRANMAAQLLQSVHTFSAHPIVMINFGMATPVDWTPEKYPKMILLHGSPLPASAQRSPSLDKFRAVIVSRVKVGIILDVDEWAGPRVDNLFNLTIQEVNRDYPLPIMPVHFLDKQPEAGSATWWHRFCPTGTPCALQTTRWGHNHPTWTFWALPFFGRWLRRNFRDEVLFARSDMEDVAQNRLRLADVAGDEDLMNVAIWEESGTKQWCKFDVPDSSEFEALLTAKGRTCKTHCDDIASDPRFHPNSVPKVFYTACHAVEPEVSARIIAQLADSLHRGKLPPPILYKGRFYTDGNELKTAYPSLSCII